MLDAYPKFAHYTLERVLVTTGDIKPTDAIAQRFDRILGVGDLFDACTNS